MRTREQRMQAARKAAETRERNRVTRRVGEVALKLVTLGVDAARLHAVVTNPSNRETAMISAFASLASYARDRGLGVEVLHRLVDEACVTFVHEL